MKSAGNGKLKQQLTGKVPKSMPFPPQDEATLNTEEQILAQITRLKRQLDTERKRKVKDDSDAAEAEAKQTSRLIVVANRLPLTDLSRDPDSNEWTHKLSAGGIYRAFMGVKDTAMTWVGWPGTVFAEEDQGSAKEYLMERDCAPVFLTEAVVDAYHNGYSNNVLWSLFHYIPLSMLATDENDEQEEQWLAYVEANRQYAELVKEQYMEGDVIWIQDYHLMLVPSMLRELLGPTVPIGWFLHTPFCASEVYRTLPKRKEILRGLLGADLIGFHIYDYARHFANSCSRILGSEVLQENKYLFDTINRRAVLTDAFPIGIDPDFWADQLDTVEVKDMIISLQRRFDGKRILLGVDRLDYVKGIPHKLLAMEHFLDEHPEWARKIVLVQIAVPAHGSVHGSRKLADQVHKLVGRINGKHGTLEDAPLHYLDQHIEHTRLAAMYALADVALVTSLRDGMNLVGMEYVACQKEHCGVLVLSELAGAAQGLGAGAVLVNPFNIVEMSNAINECLNMTRIEREERHEYLYQHITKNTAQQWANNFLSDLKNIDHAEETQIGFDLDVERDEPNQMTAETRKAMMKGYKRAKKSLMIFGLVECLLSFNQFKTRGLVDESIRESLSVLAEDPNTTVVVMSGRERAVLDDWVGMLPVWLVAENGLFYRFGGRDQEWQSLEEPMDTSWHESVKPVFKYFEERTPNTFLEVQESSMTWHYNEAEDEFAELQASDLTAHVEKVLANVPVEVLMNNDKVEVRPHGISKGDTLDLIMEELGYRAAVKEDIESSSQIDPLEPLDVEASSPPEDSIEEASTPTAAETSTPSMTPDRPQADRRKERIKAHHDRKKSITKATDFDMKSPTSGDPMPALQGLNISKLSSLDSLSEYVNPDPIDFVLCMGNFSMRDEDMYKNLMNVHEDFEYAEHLPSGDKKMFTIKVGHALSSAQYSLSSQDDVEGLLESFANISAEREEALESMPPSDNEYSAECIDNFKNVAPYPVPHALHAFNQVKQICANKQLAFFLDYDGTLTPIVPHPPDAIMSEKCRATVRALAQLFPTAIVTGRTKATAHDFIQLDDLWYAGSHGFDIGRGLSDNADFGYSVASSYQPALIEARTELERMLENVEGMLIEDNTFAISVHYRNVSEEERPIVLQYVEEVMSTRPMLRMTNGKMVYELRPAVDWHKGKAVEWLLNVIKEDIDDELDIVPIYIGDDVTDEDAFRVLGDLGGIGIFVGDEPLSDSTEAKFYVDDPEQVRQFLEQFVIEAPHFCRTTTEDNEE